MKILITILSLLIVHCVRAQEWETPGKLVVGSDTANVTLVLPGSEKGLWWESVQWSIKFLDNQNHERIAHADTAKAVIFNFQNNVITMAATKYNGTGLYRRNLFLRLLETGPVKSYVNQYTANANMAGMAQLPASMYLLQRGDEDLIPFAKMGFKKDAVKFFKDCPEIVAKVESKEYRLDDLPAMAKFYNANCGNN